MILYLLRHERDVTAQTEAVYALEFYPSPTTRSALEVINCINIDKFGLETIFFQNSIIA